MKAKIVLVMIGALALGACATDQGVVKQTQLVAVTPPANLYQCPNPAHPNPDTLTDKQVARYIASIWAARNSCMKSLNAIQTYSEKVKTQIETPAN